MFSRNNILDVIFIYYCGIKLKMNVVKLFYFDKVLVIDDLNFLVFYKI